MTFYPVLWKNGARSLHNLSHGWALGCNRYVGQISMRLLGSAQAITNQESFVHQKTKIVGLELYATGGLAVQQGRHSNRCRASGLEIAQQKIGSHPGMNQALDQQNVFAADIAVMAEEDLEKTSSFLLLVSIFRLDELAGDGNLKGAHEVGHKDETVFEKREGVNSLIAIVVGNLACHLAHPLLELLGGDQDLQVRF